MKKTIAFLLGVATIIGTSMPALAADQNIGEPMVISTNVSNNKVYVNNEEYTIGHFVDSKSDDVLAPIGMPNPIEEFNTVQEAQKSLKFKTVVPKEIPSEYKVNFISTISKELFQICYSNDKNDILFRMAQGIDKVDGDYNEYKFNKTIQVNGTSVNLKGNSSNLVNLATYKINDMSYSISVTNGMSENDITKMIKSTF